MRVEEFKYHIYLRHHLNWSIVFILFYCWVHLADFRAFPLLWLFMIVIVDIHGFVWLYALFLFIVYRVELLGHMVTLFNILKNCQTIFQSGCTISYSHQECVREPIYSIYLPVLVVICLFVYSHPLHIKVECDLTFFFFFLIEANFWRCVMIS